MKKQKNNVGAFLKKIYGYGIFFSLFLGGASVLAYLAAIAIGGETAVTICTFIYKKFFTWLIIFTGVLVLLGMVSMYFQGEKAMALENKDLGE